MNNNNNHTEASTKFRFYINKRKPACRFSCNLIKVRCQHINPNTNQQCKRNIIYSIINYCIFVLSHV